jgi:hypothetical protein
MHATKKETPTATETCQGHRIGGTFHDWHELADFPPLTDGVLEQAFRHAFGKGAAWAFEQMGQPPPQGSMTV